MFSSTKKGISHGTTDSEMNLIEPHKTLDSCLVMERQPAGLMLSFACNIKNAPSSCWGRFTFKAMINVNECSVYQDRFEIFFRVVKG